MVVVPLYSKVDIPAETLDKHSGSSTAPNCPTKPQRQPLGTVSASLWPSVSPASLWLGLRQPLEALRQPYGPLHHPHWPSEALRNSWLALREPLVASASLSLATALILPVLSLPLCFCIHCPSAATLITLSTFSAHLAPKSRNIDLLVYSPSDPQASSYTFLVDISTAKIKSLIDGYD